MGYRIIQREFTVFFLFQPPDELYDMIFVADAKPTKIITEKWVTNKKCYEFLKTIEFNG